MKNKKNDNKIETDNKAVNKDIAAILSTVILSIKELRERLENKIEQIQLQKGDKGESYKLTSRDKDEIAETILENLEMPEPEKFVLTNEDKQAIAKLITPPVVERIVEKKETIREISPQVRETIKETIPEEKLKKIETNIVENLPQFGTTFRDALELLRDDDRLDVSAIKGLDDRFSEVEKKIVESRASVISPIRGHIKNYDLSPFLDGLTTTFNLPANWSIINVVASSFPSVLRPQIDYTFTSTQIQFTSAIQASSTLAGGQTVIVVYEEA